MICLNTFRKIVVSLINALTDLRTIRQPCQSTMKIRIFFNHQIACINFCNIFFWHGSIVYFLWTCLFTDEHGYTSLWKILYIWVIALFDMQVFFKLFFSISYSLTILSSSLKIIRMKSMYFGPEHSFRPHTLGGIC